MTTPLAFQSQESLKPLPIGATAPDFSLPDAEGKPAGLTLPEFIQTIRTGHDAVDGHPLFVMPWPTMRNMNDRDLSAIYEYLRSIPHAEPGTCTGAGQ